MAKTGDFSVATDTAKYDSGVTPSDTQGCDLLLFKFMSPRALRTA
jgi:hypothetical protein